MAKTNNDLIIEVIHTLQHLTNTLSNSGDDNRWGLHSISNEISNLESTISVELSCLTDAIKELTDEVRIAGGSDFGFGGRRRTNFKEIKKCEHIIKKYESEISADMTKQQELMKDCEDCHDGQKIEQSEEYQTLEKAIQLRCELISKYEEKIEHLTRIFE